VPGNWCRRPGGLAARGDPGGCRGQGGPLPRGSLRGGPGSRAGSTRNGQDRRSLPFGSGAYRGNLTARLLPHRCDLAFGGLVYRVDPRPHLLRNAGRLAVGQVENPPRPPERVRVPESSGLARIGRIVRRVTVLRVSVFWVAGRRVALRWVAVRGTSLRLAGWVRHAEGNQCRAGHDLPAPCPSAVPLRQGPGAEEPHPGHAGERLAHVHGCPGRLRTESGPEQGRISPRGRQRVAAASCPGELAWAG
jgi:hypothetical protein